MLSRPLEDEAKMDNNFIRENGPAAYLLRCAKEDVKKKEMIRENLTRYSYYLGGVFTQVKVRDTLDLRPNLAANIYESVWCTILTRNMIFCIIFLAKMPP